MFTLAGSTCAGAKKVINQDGYCALEARTAQGPAALVAVCDGVGGLSSGELASSAAVDALVGWFERDLPPAILWAGDSRAALEAAKKTLLGRLRELNARVFAYSEALGVRMGTTVTAALMLDGSWLVAQVGDSRAFLVSGDAWELLTDDQAASPGSSELLQAVGSQEALDVVFEQGSYGPGDLMAVCCDGLWRTVPPEELGAALVEGAAGGEGRMREAQRSLISRAMSRGESDNITVACARAPELFAEGAASRLPDGRERWEDAERTVVVGTAHAAVGTGRPRKAMRAAARALLSPAARRSAGDGGPSAAGRPMGAAPSPALASL